MTSEDDIGFERMLDWAEGRLEPSQAAQVARAMAAGGAVGAAAAWVEEFLSVAGTGAGAQPPAYLRGLLVQRFEDRMRVTRGPGPAARLRAALTFDSALGVAPVGARGALDAPEAERHLVYSSPALELALDLYLSGEGVRVDGQVLPRDEADEASATLRVLRGTAEVAAATADDLGEFTLDHLPPGPYQLLVTLGRSDVVVDVELGG